MAFSAREDGVADVLGSILLVAITVVMALALGALIFSFPAPKDLPRTSLSITVQPGNANWGNGDEKLVVTNTGGEPLQAGTTTIVYTINSGTAVSVTGSALGWTNGILKIGQSWTKTLTLQATDNVALNVLTSSGASALLGAANMVPAQVSAGSSCPFDIVAPTGAWAQSPTNLTTSLASLTVTVTLNDDCAGIDTTVVPHIFWAVTPASPTDKGVMTQVSTFVWTATIAPAGGFGASGGQTLQYYASPLTDLRGNSGQSSTMAAAVALTGTVQYVDTHTEVAPTILQSGGTNLQAADGNSAVFQEGSTSGTTTLAANAVVSSGTGWSTGTNAFASDNAYATNANNNPGALRLSFPDPTAGGPITAVKVNLEQSVVSFVDDTWAIQACFNPAGGSTCNTISATQLGTISTSADVVRVFDITGARPGGGSWTWTDINNLEILVQPGKGTNAARDGTWRADLVSVDVTANTFSAKERLEWTSLATSSTNHYLEIKGTGASDETFNINVCQAPAFTTCVTRGTIVGTGSTTTTYLLLGSPAEYQTSGATRVRVEIVDNAADAVQSTFSLDYARITTP